MQRVRCAAVAGAGGGGGASAMRDACMASRRLGPTCVQRSPPCVAGPGAPKNWTEAMARPDAALWKRACNKELTIFDELGAMSHGHSEEQLDDWDLPKRAVPLIFVFKVKWLPGSANAAPGTESTNEETPTAKTTALALYDKHKLRCCLQGHPGYMIAHVHFNPDETYASSPAAPMMRLIMSIAFLQGWQNLVFDIIPIPDNIFFPIQLSYH